MKLKIFRGILLTSLFSVTLVILMLFGFSCYDIAFNTKKVSDSIVLIISFIVLTVFAIIHIVNTFISFKKGSAFLVGLCYDEYKKLNKRGIIIAGIGLVIGIFGLIYGILMITDRSIPLGMAPAPLKLMIIGFALLVIVDMIAILTYPLVGQLDPSYKEK